MVFSKRFSKKKDASEISQEQFSQNNPDNNTIAEDIAEGNIQNTEAEQHIIQELKEKIEQKTGQIDTSMDTYDIEFDDSDFNIDDEEHSNTGLLSAMRTRLMFLISFIITNILKAQPHNKIARKMKDMLDGNDEEETDKNILGNIIELLEQLETDNVATGANKIKLHIAKKLGKNIQQVETDKDYFENKLALQYVTIERMYLSLMEHKSMFQERPTPQEYTQEIEKLAPTNSSEKFMAGELTEALATYEQHYQQEQTQITKQQEQISLYVTKYIATLTAYKHERENKLREKSSKLVEKAEKTKKSRMQVDKKLLEIEKYISTSNTLRDTSIQRNDILINNSIALINLFPVDYLDMEETIKIKDLSYSDLGGDKQLQENFIKIQYIKETYEQTIDAREAKKARTEHLGYIHETIQQKNKVLDTHIDQLTTNIAHISGGHIQQLLKDMYCNTNDSNITTLIQEITSLEHEAANLIETGVDDSISPQKIANMTKEIIDNLQSTLAQAGVTHHAHLMKALIGRNIEKQIAISTHTALENNARDMEEIKYRELKTMNIDELDTKKSYDRYRSGSIAYAKNIQVAPLTTGINELISSAQEKTDQANILFLNELYKVAAYITGAHTDTIMLIRTHEGKLYFLHFGKKLGKKITGSFDEIYEQLQDVTVIPFDTEQGKTLLENSLATSNVDQKELYDIISSSRYINNISS